LAASPIATLPKPVARASPIAIAFSSLASEELPIANAFVLVADAMRPIAVEC